MTKSNVLFAGCLCALGALAASCSSDNDVQALNASIRLSVQTDTGFSSSRAALDESEYSKGTNYALTILKDGKAYLSYDAGKVPSTLNVEAGTYVVRAFYGEDKAASTSSMYVTGETSVTVAGTETEAIPVTVLCKPVCAKATVKFGTDMDTYFKDYSVVFHTAALDADGTTFVWTKTNSDPVYLKVGEAEQVRVSFNLTKKDDTTATITDKTYTLSPNTALTLNVTPVVSDDSGTLGLTITIDESTNDHPINIVVPYDWK